MGKWTTEDDEEFESLCYLYGPRWKLISRHWTKQPHRSYSSIRYQVLENVSFRYSAKYGCKLSEKYGFKDSEAVWNEALLHLHDKTTKKSKRAQNLNKKMIAHLIDCKEKKTYTKCDVCKAIILKRDEIVAAVALIRLLTQEVSRGKVIAVKCRV